MRKCTRSRRGRWTWSPSHRHALHLVASLTCGQLQWLGLRSCRFHVGAGAFGAWLCLWEITRVFGKNNLVPTVTASFDVLEAGDMVEGCSIWVSVWLGSNRCRLGCFLICRLLLRRLRFRFCVCGFDPVRNFCGWLLFSAPSLPRLCSARRLVSCRLFDPPTHYVSLVRECSDWGLA